MRGIKRKRSIITHPFVDCFGNIICREVIAYCRRAWGIGIRRTSSLHCRGRSVVTVRRGMATDSDGIGCWSDRSLRRWCASLQMRMMCSIRIVRMCWWMVWSRICTIVIIEMRREFIDLIMILLA